MDEPYVAIGYFDRNVAIARGRSRAVYDLVRLPRIDDTFSIVWSWTSAVFTTNIIYIYFLTHYQRAAHSVCWLHYDSES